MLSHMQEVLPVFNRRLGRYEDVDHVWVHGNYTRKCPARKCSAGQCRFVSCEPVSPMVLSSIAGLLLLLYY